MGSGQNRRLLAALVILALAGLDRATASLCEGQADIVFALDASGSISSVSQYPLELQFAAAVTDQFMVSPSKIRIAAISFSSNVRQEFNFLDNVNNADVKAALLAANYEGSLTYTGKALRYIRVNLLTTPNGARPNVKDIVVVITDGYSTNSTDTLIETQLLKMTATVFAIGVGNGVSQSELNAIASGPSYVFNVQDFNALSTIRDEVAKQVCNVPDTGNCINNCVGKDDGDYAACAPKCEDGYYYSCVNQFTYERECAAGYYQDSNGNQFLARLVYNPSVGACVEDYAKCPRNPEDHKITPSNGGNSISHSYNNTCLHPWDSCVGRENGNYPKCQPECQGGYYYACSNDERYEMPCQEGRYVDSNGQEFFARLVYDPSTDKCLYSSTACPRNDEDFSDPQTNTDPSTNYTDPQTCQSTGKADIVLVLDSSGSVGKNNYQILLAFAASVTSNFPVSPNDVQFSTIIFSTNIVTLFNFNSYSNQADVANAILNAPYLNGLTYTDKALAIAGTFSFSALNGARPNVGKVAIVVTDGLSTNPTNTVAEATALKNLGVTVVAVGIGNANAAELLSIASSPAHVFTVNNFAGLSAIQNALVQSTCPTVTDCNKGACAGLPDGDYAACSPKCAEGYYTSCVAGYAYTMPCALAAYTAADGSTYYARMVYNPVTRTCEREVPYCPRDPEDYEVIPSNNTGIYVNPYNPDCISTLESCAGKANGDYPMCAPECQNGYFITCSNGETYEMPCADGWYTDDDGNRYTARMVYDPTVGRCELTAQYCPRDVTPQTTTTTTTPNPTTTPPITTTPYVCTGKADILLMMDGSGSIGGHNYAVQLSFMASLSQQFVVGPTDFQFSSLVFSTNSNIEFSFDDYTTNQQVWQAISALPYIGLGTNTADALALARTVGFTSSNGARLVVPKIAIVVTDGISANPSYTALEADKLHRQGVTVIVIGVGSGIRLSELRAIASDDSLVFTVSSYQTLSQITSTVIQVACNQQNKASACVDNCDCTGRTDGDYVSCGTETCQRGEYTVCTSGFGYRASCSLDWYYDSGSGNYFTARQVFDPSTRSCARESSACPRDPVDYASRR